MANVLLMIRRKFIHNSPYTDTRTHPYAYSYSYYFRCYLSLSLTLSLCHSVVASLPGGFHVQLVLLEWSAAAPKAATETASARRQRWQRPAFITVCAFWVFFCLFYFWSSSCFFVHSSTFVCVQLLWQFIHQAAKRANKNNNNNGSEAHTTREGDQLRRAAAAPALLLLLLLFLLSTSLY